MIIAITGATGLIGKRIAQKLHQRGDEIIVLSRSVESAKKVLPGLSKYVKWDYDSEDWYNELDGVDAVIHLAGESVMGRRWSDEHKKKILESRIKGTKSLVGAISRSSQKPKVFISASAIGYYGNRNEPVDENSSAANDFLAGVVQAWENKVAEVEKYSVRRVSIRIGIVLDKTEGALARMILPYKYFVGGPIGSGTQWLSWIHTDDLANIFLFALDNENVNGVVNAVSPHNVSMNEFSKMLGRILKRPAFFKVPPFVLRIVMGEGAEAVLGGADVQSKKIRELGYRFQFENLEKALRDILK